MRESNVTHNLLVIFLTAAITLLSGCGDVITPQPSATPSPVSNVSSASTPSPRPTATTPFLPPADTTTPTITPTPVTYVVQQGDTLQAIAFTYGVSVEALQSINGIESPQFLQIGQRLLIPAGEEEETEPGLLLPTPTPQPFEIQGTACHETAVGGLQCLGEVSNTTAVTLTNVQVRVMLLNADGETLDKASAFAAADLIPPAQRAPFGILFTTPPPNWTGYHVSVIRGRDAGTLAASYLPIAVSEVSGALAGMQIQLSGVLENLSPDEAAGSVHITATTYDAQGLVTGFRQFTLTPDEALAPGATMAFDVAFAFYGKNLVDFNVTALGRAAP